MQAELTVHPQAWAQARSSGLIPRQPTRVERAIEKRLELLDVLAEGPLEIDFAGGIPVAFALADGPAIAAALTGNNPAYFPSRRQVTSTWLGALRQMLDRR